MIRKLTCRLALLLAAIAHPLPALADTLVDHVDGLTVDREGRVERFTGLVIDNDGKVRQLLRRGDKRPAKVDYLVDGKGRVLIPGMIDSHVHMIQIGMTTLMLDLTGTKSLAEAQARIAAHAAAHPDKPWILGFGWNQESWGLGRMPTAAEIDAAVTDRPVWLMRVDGHAGWANSAAMTAAGITAASRAPAGGRIDRIAGSTRPSGILVDAATDLVQRIVPAPRPEDRDLALSNAQDILLRQGITAVADMGTTIDDWQAFRRAGDSGGLRLRIMAYAAGIDAMVLIGGPAPTPWLYDDRLRLNGVKLFVDGALGSHGAALKAPYADDPGNSGLLLTDSTKLGNQMSRAAMDNFQVAVHAIGDAANRLVLDAIEELSETYKGDRRWRIEHAQIVDPADLARFGKHGIVASMQPVHQASDRAMAEVRLGPSRLAGAYAWNGLANAGARLAFGSDAPVEAPDPFAGIATAITRQDANGQPFDGWQPQERISREAALAAYTAGAAHAGFAEGRFGRLAVGERADFLLVDEDPLLAPATAVRNITVEQTWVAGRLAWSKP
ncbi:MAG: amidohydrolase family protein [Novosphingobium sp.]